MKGFALGITLIFIFLFTLLGFAILMIAGNYYSSVRNLMDDENGQVLCDSAIGEMVDRHNLDSTATPFFFDPALWQKNTLKSYDRMGFTISAKFGGAWSPISVNQLTTSARRGNHLAEQTAGISQIRMENFALYTDGSFILPLSSLFDGLVFVRNGMELLQPDVRFLEITQGNFFPSGNAAFQRKTFHTFAYPELGTMLTGSALASQALITGVLISGKNPIFWQAGNYEIDLDQLQINPVGNKWQIRYKGADVGIASSLLLWFDDRLTIHQADRNTSYLAAEKPKAPLYLGSIAEIVLDSNLLPLESAKFTHPLCLISAGSVRISSKVPIACRLQSLLIALGTDALGSSLVIEPGGTPITAQQKAQFIFEMNTSSFVHEDSKLNALQTALDAQQKVVWFRGSLITRSGIAFSGDLSQVHFQESYDGYPLLPPFPFVRIAEGTRQWR